MEINNKSKVNDIKNNIDNIERDIQLNEMNQTVSNNINKINIKIDKINKGINNNNSNNEEIEKIRNIYVDPKDLLKPIGILDPNGLELNPLTGNPYENLYSSEENGGKTYKEWSEIWKIPNVSKKRRGHKSLKW